VRYYGGDRVPSRVPPYGGDRGVWTDVRPRRGKAREQVEDRRDRFREKQRYGGQQRQGRSRDGARYGSSRWGDGSEDSDGYGAHNLSYDDRVSYWPGTRHDNVARNSRFHAHRARRSFSRMQQHSRHDSVPRPTVLVHRRLSKQPERAVLIDQQQKQFAGAVPTKGFPPLSSHQQQQVTTVSNSGTNHVNFVSFYFTNVPEDISYRSLRQGFEVCGIMEDIYLAKKRNVNGAVFGFVRYSNVKDVDKLLKAVNNIWFGDCKVVAKVSVYDRFGHRRGEARVRGEGEKINEGEKTKNEEGINVEGEKRNVVGLSVGRKIMRVVGGAGIRKDQGGSAVHGVKPVVPERMVEEEKERAVGGRVIGHEGVSNHVFVPKYASTANDLNWATKGVVVSVLNGEVIPVLQRRIFYAGFDNLVLIPLGADKVFIRSLDDSEVSNLFLKAPDFFDNFFSKPVRWSKDLLVRERGA